MVKAKYERVRLYSAVYILVLYTVSFGRSLPYTLGYDKGHP